MLDTAERLITELPRWASDSLIVAAAIGAVLILHRTAHYILCRAAQRTTTQTDDIFIRRLRRPSRWLLVAFALASVQPMLHLHAEGREIWQRVAALVLPALLGWLAIATLNALNDSVQAWADITVENNLQARRRRTRVGILHRVTVSILLALTFCLMLMSIPSIRTVGVTLIASAGLAAIAVGAAAQPALKNLIGGLQMAFTEPIRIDDVVIINGEWGRIEEIRLTFVVVKVWDERRLVVPVSKFLEESFQNWTRETSQLLGSVFWYLDPSADVPRLREKLAEVVKANPRWDGRFFNMQVTDMKAEGAIELRALMTARDASLAFDLRCDVREAMLAYIRAEMPEALLKRRIDIDASTPSPLRA